MKTTLLAAILLVLLTTCAKQKDSPPLFLLPFTIEESEPQSQTDTIGPEGGQMTLPDGATLTIPRFVFATITEGWSSDGTHGTFNNSTYTATRSGIAIIRADAPPHPSQQKYLTIKDTLTPDDITDLIAATIDHNQIRLTWTATGQAPTRAPILTQECYPAEDAGKFEHASVAVNRQP